MTQPQLPKSVTPAGVAWASVVTFLTSTGVLYLWNPFESIIASALVILGAMVVVTFLVDVVIYKAHLRPSTGMDYGRRDMAPLRSMTKLLGLYAAVGVIALLYALLPVYENDLYDNYLTLAKAVILPLAVIAVPYVLLVDMFQRDPKDGYWHLGNIVLLRWRLVDGGQAWGCMRGWIIKGFFLPLMFSFFCQSLSGLLQRDLTELQTFAALYGFLYVFAFFFDLSIATIGYATTFRPLDTHMRSTEPTALGWVVCIICYAPVWSFITTNYLNYENDWEWGAWLWDYPLFYGIWGMAILLCLAVYVYATAQFGCRFSNLTHRGIITSGPYRWTKHPSYIFKNLSWWLVAIPFIPGDGSFETAARNCLLLGCVSGIYFLRARTEERHLSRDPDYVAYALWVEQHGIFRWIRKIPYMGWVGYSPASD